MSENFGWNYFENEVVIGDKQDKKRMIVIVFSNFMCIPYNRKSFDELVDWLNGLSDKIVEQQEKSDKLERQLRKAMIYIVSDTCSLSEAKLREVIDEIKNA